jgi:hypothetical protein
MFKIKKYLLLAGALATSTLFLASCGENASKPKVVDFALTNSSEIQTLDSVDMAVKFKNLADNKVVSYNVKKTNTNGDEDENTFSDSGNTKSDTLRYFTYSPFSYQKGDVYELTKVNFENTSIDVTGFKIKMEEDVTKTQNFDFVLNKTDNIDFEDTLECEVSTNVTGKTMKYLKAELVNTKLSKVKFEFNSYISDNKASFKMPSIKDCYEKDKSFSTANTEWNLYYKEIKFNDESTVYFNSSEYDDLIFKNEGMEAELTVSYNDLNESVTINNEKYYSYNDASFKFNNATISISNTLGLETNEVKTINMDNGVILKKSNNDFTVNKDGVHNTISLTIQNKTFKAFNFIGFTYNRKGENKDVTFATPLNLLDYISGLEKKTRYYTISSFDDVSVTKITDEFNGLGYSTVEEFLTNNSSILFATSLTLSEEQYKNSIFNGSYSLPENFILDGNGKTLKIDTIIDKPLFNENNGTIKNLIINTTSKNSILVNKNKDTIKNIKFNVYMQDFNSLEVGVIANENEGKINDIEIANYYKHETINASSSSNFYIYPILNNKNIMKNIIVKIDSNTFDSNTKALSIVVTPKENTGIFTNGILVCSPSITKAVFLKWYNNDIFFSEKYITNNLITILDGLKNDLKEGIKNAQSGTTKTGVAWLEGYETIENQAEAEQAYNEALEKLNLYYIEGFYLINTGSSTCWRTLGIIESDKNNIDEFWSFTSTDITLKFSQKTIKN